LKLDLEEAELAVDEPAQIVPETGDESWQTLGGEHVPAGVPIVPTHEART